MRVYIAARFSKRPEANQLAQKLQILGHTITSRWVLPEATHVMPTGLSKLAADSERERFARQDIEDVIACDWCISLMEKPRSNGRGGRHVEFGYALALSKKMTIIGPRETVFHHQPEVEHFRTVKDFYSSLDSPNLTSFKPMTPKSAPGNPCAVIRDHVITKWEDIPLNVKLPS